MSVPSEARAAAESAVRAVAAGSYTFASLAGAALAAAAPLIAAAERNRIQNEEPDWQWANPIADRYQIRTPGVPGGCVLHCTACDADLFTVGEMDLWEFAVEAKGHDLKKHADLPASDPLPDAEALCGCRCKKPAGKCFCCEERALDLPAGDQS